MTEQAKTPSGANAPYKIEKRGEKWVVLNNIGEVKARFDSPEEARKYQSALYASVPGASKRAAKVPFTGHAKNRIKSATQPALVPAAKPPVMDLRDRLAAPYKKAATLPPHNYLPGVDNLCLSCGLPLAAPIHSVDADAVPGAIMPGPPPIKSAYTGSGSMVALYPDAVAKLGVDVQGGPEFPVEDQAEWHVTLAYLPETPEGEDLQLLTELVNGVANVFAPLTGVWGGTARFNPSEGSDGKPVLVALPDLPGLPEFRQFLVHVLDAAGFPVAKNHGYQPHMTIAYDDNGRVRAEGPLRFAALTLSTPDQKFTFDFKGDAAGREDVIAKAAFAGARSALSEQAAAKLLCEECGKTYFADSQDEIAKHKATHAEKAKLSEKDQASYDAETERIRESSKTSEAKGVHDFKAAQWTHPNGHPRCKVCGQEESISPQCNREPTAAEEEAFQAELDAEFGPAEAARDYSGKARSKMASSGAAMSDGSFPIRNATDLKNAIQALGRAKDPAAAKAHIRKRARALGLTDLLPDSWTEKAYLEQVQVIQHPDTVAPPRGLEHVRAFITEVNGRTMLTGPASTFQPVWEKALTPNEHFLWVQGNFVGAEKANRNGAFWSTRDLEMGQPTVQHGPLNWLHEAKHVIGTIADSKLVLPVEGAAQGVQEPHIVAAAAIWKWIYPDEAFVVEQASDQQKLWYSMECVSREVSCEGDGGCGKAFPYMDVIRAKASVCSHIRQRASTRRFVDPTFLGAAVIVPPVRPGWADADARVMREAAALAETAFEDAGRPDIAATEWEQLMAQVVAYASR